MAKGTPYILYKVRRNNWLPRILRTTKSKKSVEEEPEIVKKLQGLDVIAVSDDV
ncbi:protein disulfide-isomerase TMX3-like protein [Corchorus olitorius]|uniref:Protein disulfide-isomerase TMX3-like protein n=1 Tax=Corchorus olitorius TaxID=93759 RepID=A0A1R3KGG6_9ROSI|nr:protein disulfide-isomerase TMX3-like protein [Corchorus olitorius]